MWSRYRLDVFAAGLIFLANIVVRILGVTVFHNSDNGQIRSGYGFLTAAAVVMLAAGYWWFVRYPSSRALPNLGLVALSSCLACVIIGPPLGWCFGKLASTPVDANPFAGGAGLFFSEIWHFLGVAIVAGVLGLLIAIAFGQDHRTKALNEFTHTVGAKPHRTVRR